LTNGKLGLIDYGQTKKLDPSERLQLADIVSKLGKNTVNASAVAESMRDLGFVTKHDKDDIMARYAMIFFDSDLGGRDFGVSHPQLYLMKLSEIDPLEQVPDAAGEQVIHCLFHPLVVVAWFSERICTVMVARASFLFRGMGFMVNEQVETSKRWSAHAKAALLALL